MTDDTQAAARLRGYVTYLAVHGMDTRDLTDAADRLDRAAAEHETLEKIRAWANDDTIFIAPGNVRNAFYPNNVLRAIRERVRALLGEPG